MINILLRIILFMIVTHLLYLADVAVGFKPPFNNLIFYLLIVAALVIIFFKGNIFMRKVDELQKTLGNNKTS